MKFVDFLNEAKEQKLYLLSKTGGFYVVDPSVTIDKSKLVGVKEFNTLEDLYKAAMERDNLDRDEVEHLELTIKKVKDEIVCKSDDPFNGSTKIKGSVEEFINKHIIE